MNVLLTGGCGYIGSHTARALRDAGHKTIIVDNLSKSTLNRDEGFIVHEISLHDTSSLANILKEHAIEAVVHMAAFIEVGESVQNPLSYYENNVGGSLSLFRAMSTCNVDTLIFSSTAAVYGEPEIVPIPEDHPKNPLSPYGKSKLIVEQIISDLDVKSVRLRYFNASGAHHAGGIGESHNPETHLIPRACFAALGAIPPLEIYGNDFDTPDGTAIRDYVHVEDIAAAHVLALDYLDKGGTSDVFNLGLGDGFSVKEVIAAVEKVSGKTVPATFSGRRPGDAARLIADSTKAREVLKWSPTNTSITDITKTAWNWHAATRSPATPTK